VYSSPAIRLFDDETIWSVLVVATTFSTGIVAASNSVASATRLLLSRKLRKHFFPITIRISFQPFKKNQIKQLNNFWRD
jgi:hypothetical protein